MTDLIVRENNLPDTAVDLSKFVLFGDEALNALRAKISALKKLNAAKEVVELQLRQAQDTAENVTLAKIKLGEILNSLPKANNGGANQYQAQSPAVSNKQKPKGESIAELGLSQKKAERLQQMASNPEIVHAAIAKARVNDDVISESQILNEIKQAKRKEEIQKQAAEIEQQAIEQPNGLFDVIVIDPPWNYGTSYDPLSRRCANPYPEMPQEELRAIELPSTENCVLFLWTTHKFIWVAKELLDHWGFNYRCMFVWNKQEMGMGNLIRMQCEFCLIGIKGKPVFKDVHNIRDLIEEPRREHSRKPEAFYNLVSELCTGRKYRFAIEVKTKPKLKKYPETGIDYYLYERYLKFSSEINLPVYLIFVDEDCKEIYGNFLHELDKPVTYQNINYPKNRTWKNGTNKTRYFPMCHMKHIGDLRTLEAEYLKMLSRSNYLC